MPSGSVVVESLVLRLLRYSVTLAPAMAALLGSSTTPETVKAALEVVSAGSEPAGAFCPHTANTGAKNMTASKMNGLLGAVSVSRRAYPGNEQTSLCSCARSRTFQARSKMSNCLIAISIASSVALHSDASLRTIQRVDRPANTLRSLSTYLLIPRRGSLAASNTHVRGRCG